MIFVSGPVECIGTAAGNHRNLPAARSPEIGRAAGRDKAEFLNRVDRHGQNTLKGCRRLLIIDVHAVQRDIGLVTASPCYAASTSVGAALIVNTRINHAGLQAQETDNVACLERQGDDLWILNAVADGGVHRIHQGQTSRKDVDLDHESRFQLQVQRRRRVYQKM